MISPKFVLLFFIFSISVLSIDIFFGTYVSNQVQTGLESEPFHDINIGLNQSLQKTPNLDLNLGDTNNDYYLIGLYNVIGCNISIRLFFFMFKGFEFLIFTDHTNLPLKK